MAAPAIAEIFAERAFFVMTAGTGLRARRSEVHRGERRRNLSSERHSGSNRVTRRAVHRARVRRVTEIYRVGFDEIRAVVRSARLVTRSARAEISFARLRLRRVTPVTGRMRVKSGRFTESDAAPRRFMTRRAIRLAVYGVLEPDVKTSETRKRFNARRRMADLADRMLISGGELLFVAARAGQMTGVARDGRIVVLLVAEQARKSLMLRLRVRKVFVTACLRFDFFDRFVVSRFPLDLFVFDFFVRARSVSPNAGEQQANDEKND